LAYCYYLDFRTFDVCWPQVSWHGRFKIVKGPAGLVTEEQKPAGQRG